MCVNVTFIQITTLYSLITESDLFTSFWLYIIIVGHFVASLTILSSFSSSLQACVVERRGEERWERKERKERGNIYINLSTKNRALQIQSPIKTSNDFCHFCQLNFDQFVNKPSCSFPPLSIFHLFAGLWRSILSPSWIMSSFLWWNLQLIRNVTMK